jgi:hypothetical protein
VRCYTPGSTISRTQRATKVCDRRVREKLFPGLIFLVLGVTLLAFRTISKEEGSLGLVMKQLPHRFFRLFIGIEFVHICVLVLIQRVVPS